MIPDEIELNLSALTAPENRDRVLQITRLLKEILFSEEVTLKADADGDWPQDSDWALARGTRVSLRKVPIESFRDQMLRRVS